MKVCWQALNEQATNWHATNKKYRMPAATCKRVVGGLELPARATHSANFVRTGLSEESVKLRWIVDYCCEVL